MGSALIITTLLAVGNLKIWLQLFRIGNGFIAFGAVWVGYLCFPVQLTAIDVLFGSMGLMLLALAGNVDNDRLDIHIDKIAHPDRPLPKKFISPQMALYLSIFLCTTGMVFCWLISFPHLLFGIVIAFMLAFYNRWFKKTPLFGNVNVALLCAAAPWLPEYPQFPKVTLIPALFAFLTTLTREITKDIEDREGDKKSGLKTLPISYGNALSKKIALVLIVLIIGILPIPVTHFDYNWSFLTIAALLTALPLFRVFFLLYSSPHSGASLTSACHRSQKLLKFAMLGGILAIISGVVFQ